MKKWYKIEVYRAHQGSGRTHTVPAFIFAKDIPGALSKYKTMPGVKRRINSGSKFPQILSLSEEDATNLERKIIDEKRISLEKAKSEWYYDLSNFFDQNL